MNQTPKKKYRANLNGYRCSHRNKYLFVTCGILTIQELVLWEFYADQTVFDPAKDNYGTFSVNFSHLQKIFRVKSTNTVRNWHKGLVDKGFVVLYDNPNIYQLVDFQRYFSSARWRGTANDSAKNEKDQQIEQVMQLIGIDEQIIAQNMQLTAQDQHGHIRKTTPKALSSSKDKSRVSPQRTMKYYQEKHEEGGYNLSTPSDLAWISRQDLSSHTNRDPPE